VKGARRDDKNSKLPKIDNTREKTTSNYSLKNPSLLSGEIPLLFYPILSSLKKWVSPHLASLQQSFFMKSFFET